MSKFDEEYIALCERIINEGQQSINRTGTDTLKVFGHVFRFDLKKEFPFLTSRFVPCKGPILEMLWIYQQQSNDVRWLQERGVPIWNEWAADENGNYMAKNLGKDFAHTIGTAYGWIVNKYKLIHNLIETLKNNPTDRRMVVSLWQNEHLPTACLPSCVWSTQWNVTNGKLNVVVSHRSCDVALGLPFNVPQYAVLANLIAQVTNLEIGEMLYVINDAHLYVNHLDAIKKQIAKYKEAGSPPAPKLWINPEIKDFFAFDSSRELKDIQIRDYQYNMKFDRKDMPISI